MVVYEEFCFDNFRPEGMAKYTCDRIRKEGKERELERVLHELHPDGIERKALNRFLSEDPDKIFSLLNIGQEEYDGYSFEERDQEDLYEI